METSELLALLAVLISSSALGTSVWQGFVARRASGHAKDSAEAAKISAAAALEANRLSSITAKVAQNQDKRESAKASREFTGWAIERAAHNTDYKITNLGHELAFLHALEGPTNPQLYDAAALMRRNDSTEFHIEESISTEDRYVVVVWTDQSHSWSRHTVPLP